MSLGAYEVFIAIAERGSLAAAAQQLHLSPSAVSHALTAFEQDLGFSLFVRNRSGVKLTVSGEALMPSVRAVLNANEALHQQAARLQGLQTGTVHLGAFSSVSIAWVPRLISGFTQRYPHIHVVVEQGGYEDVTDWLLTQKVDLGFVTVPGAPGLELVPVYDDPLVCIAPAHFKPVHRHFVTVAELSEQDGVVQRDDYGKEIQGLLSQNKIALKTRARGIDDAAIIAMVDSGLGVGVMAELTARNYKSSVKMYPFLPAEKRTIAVASLKYAALSPAAKVLHDYMVDTIESWYPLSR